MNKTVTANISGVVFHIEADAYEKLSQYLNTIRNYFHDSDGKDEIMADIEARIAELFKESMDAGKEVVTDANVQKVIEVMGEPEQYMDVDASEAYSESNSNQYESRGYAAFKTKKLFRDTDDNVAGGVCSGLGYYFGIDKIWFRAAFLIGFFGFGAGFLFYFILWIIIPAAKSTAEKLEMKGEPINVENIGNAIKDEFNTFKKKVNDGDGRHYGKKAENAFFKFFDFISKLLIFFLKFLGKLIGVVFIIISTLCIIAMLVALVGGPMNFNVDRSIFSSAWSVDMAEIYFNSPTIFYAGLIGLILVVFIPLLSLLYGGLKILFNIPSSNKVVTISSISLLVIGMVLISFSATSTISQYSNKQKMTETIVLPELSSDTLILSSLKSSYSTNNFGSFELYTEDGEIFVNELEVDVVQSTSSDIELLLTKASRGANRKEAGLRAENILFEYELEDNKLMIDPFISFPEEDRYRDQELKISIALPVGKSIYLAPSATDIIYDIENVTNTHDRKMMKQHWIMTEEGLSCTDCNWIEYREEGTVPPEPPKPPKFPEDNSSDV